MIFHRLVIEFTVLMIMASHQTFSGQLKHLTGQTKFGQSNILYIINGKVIKFLIEKPMSGQFSILIISIEFTTKLRSARFHGVTSPSVKTIWYVMFHYIYVSSAVFVLSRAIIRILLSCMASLPAMLH